MNEQIRERIERIANEATIKWVEGRGELTLDKAFIAALTAFAEEEQKDQEEQNVERIMHDVFMESLLDDLGAPRHPDNDKTRPAFGPYGRLKAYADSIGVKASMWEPITPPGEQPEETYD